MTAGAEVGAPVFELKVLVHEGRHFPSDTSFEVNGVFDDEQHGTGFTRLSTTPVWSGPALTWKRSVGEIKRLQAQGTKLKLTGTRPSPTRARVHLNARRPVPDPPRSSS
jgi:hypothetical protein